MARALVQVEATGRHIIAEGRMRAGQTFWTSRERARQLIDANVARYVGAEEPAEKNESAPAADASGAGQDGPSTDSPSSSPPGEDAPPSASQEARASAAATLKSFVVRGSRSRRGGSASSS